MESQKAYDAVLVGSGPNGLAAAVRLAQTGARVRVIEARDTIGGGTRSGELTPQGYVHDVCSAIHPLGLGSPYLRTLPLAQFGLDYIHPNITLAHPLDGSTAVLIQRSIDRTARGLGDDANAYTILMGPLVGNWKKILADFLGPFPLPPQHPFITTHFGVHAIRPATGLAGDLATNFETCHPPINLSPRDGR